MPPQQKKIKWGKKIRDGQQYARRGGDPGAKFLFSPCCPPWQVCTWPSSLLRRLTAPLSSLIFSSLPANLGSGGSGRRPGEPRHRPFLLENLMGDRCQGSHHPTRRGCRLHSLGCSQVFLKAQRLHVSRAGASPRRVSVAFRGCEATRVRVLAPQPRR